MLRESATAPAGEGEPETGGAGRSARVSLHASCVDLQGTGVVRLGPPGCAKSDLALRLIDDGARLVADDRLAVERHGDHLIARPPAAIAGLIEVRGLGIMQVDHAASSRLGLVVTLGAVEPASRLPEPGSYELLGVPLPCLALDPRTASAPAKIRLALTAPRVG
jgi:serine kinase of HPr protein (carbohydrate metabolism regulator)